MNLLSDIWFANISPILCIVFLLSWWCPLKHKVFNFDDSYWFIFSFVVCGITSKKSLFSTRSGIIMHMFSPKNISVIAFTFVSLIHFELIFYMVGIRSPISFFCWCLSSCSNIIFLKRLFFPLSIYLGMLSENQLTRDIALWSFIWVCLFFLIESSSFFSYKNF